MKNHSEKFKMPRPHRPAHPGVPALEWLGDVSGRSVRMTAVGCRRILIENHTGVQDFSDGLVCLSTAGGPLRIHGCELELCEVRKNALIVRGHIRQVDLPESGGAE